jgi:hypothetical protein
MKRALVIAVLVCFLLTSVFADAEAPREVEVEAGGIAVLKTPGGNDTNEAETDLEGEIETDTEGEVETDEAASPMSVVWKVGTMLLWGAGMFGMWLGHLYLNQNNVLYHPEQPQGMKRPMDIPPMAKLGSPSMREPPLPFDTVYVSTEDGEKLHAWMIWAAKEEDRSKVPTLLFLHGNAGSEGCSSPLGLWLPISRSLCAQTWGFGCQTSTCSMRDARVP